MNENLAPVVAHTLVPVVVLDDVGRAAGLAEALVAGGLPVAEVTLRTSAAVGAIEAMSRYPELLVGAGTVRSVEQVDRAVEAGARFVVSPGLSRVVVERCGELGVAVLPGAVTATEVQAAFELGLGTVKFFPAQTSGGVPAIKALAAPFGDMAFVPTGGVGPGNLADYLAVPAVVGVGGSWMCPREAVAAGDFVTVERLTREAVELVSRIKES
ncbi:MAG TPA: bifunctional 4-hydroxy-2-oxoglutarate aldolase/2-dehydro-3-deoxy-phosphogluconate aldolase [Propionibacterium sp.]|nr:bifunctional 4-hydroxy-2-oxoglutarate aldolase/2-dehydro-3-deoxy-phosphogluconate aldolase [Propionibacterium sp.]